MPSETHRSLTRLSRHFRGTGRDGFRLRAFSPDDTRDLQLKDRTDALLDPDADDEAIWIITDDLADRHSTTTVLWPSDY